jgi:rubrerythrin
MAKANHATAAAILAQIKNEADARQEYEQFLSQATDLAPDDVSAIQEIEQDEANHLLILQAMLKCYDGGISAAPDGAMKAIKEIAAGITNGD